ncbi:MAG TPA: hypothetical protein PK166_03620 [Candidatus Hydrogenedentes bacterium]|nr:hypothetical protein [Candidatus Hydrogenedentota bacterium]HQE76151.1 hypothetical protein [Candidatus Hydrogenedentota bacterium]HQH67457.1 hypothetical protein [Candidatus Hydrogenedentota bacterium]
MAITLNGLVLDDMLVSVREQHEEVGGRDARTIEIAGLIPDERSVAAIETRLDALLEAASAADYSAELSIRAGRRLMVRRTAFRRAVQRASLTGSFTLRLEARTPFEEAMNVTEIPWAIMETPSTRVVASTGTAFAQPVIRLRAGGTLVQPAVSDGKRRIEYDGVVGEGSVLLFDAVHARVLLEDEDVTPYALGEFPRIGPGETTLTFTDEPAGAHRAEAAVAYRDRWW